MIFIITRIDVHREFHHLPEDEIHLRHTHAKERLGDSMISLIHGHCDLVFYMKVDGAIRVLHSSNTVTEYPDLASALKDAPWLGNLRF